MNDTAAKARIPSAPASGRGSTCDAVVIGGDIDALVAATRLASSGAKVLLMEEGAHLGGALREIEFAPGHRAAPLAPARHTSVLALGDDEPLLLHLAADEAAVAHTAQALKRRSAKDAETWGGFIRRIHACAGFLAEVYRAPPPRIDADTVGELFTLAGLARKFRKLGRAGMADLLRVLPIPIADLLDDELESAALKGALAALAVSDLAQGPAAAGTAFALLHRQVGVNRAIAERSSDLVATHAERARAAGVTIQLNTRVARVNVVNGRVTGVVPESGEEVACSTVISSIDPYRSLIELVDAKHHDPEFIHAVRNIRFRGVATKILVALDALPPIPGFAPAQDAFPGSIVIAPAIRYVERAYEATKYGACSEQPFIEIRFPGPHVAIVHVQYTPYRLREGHWDTLRDAIADRAMAEVDSRIPGFSARVRARKVLAPPDLEATFGIREGAVSQGEMTLDQVLFMRPVPDASRYATPIEGYYICGAGTHPGAGIHGISGELAAAASRAQASKRAASAR